MPQKDNGMTFDYTGYLYLNCSSIINLGSFEQFSMVAFVIFPVISDHSAFNLVQDKTQI